MDQEQCLTDLNAQIRFKAGKAVINIHQFELNHSPYNMKWVWNFGSVILFNELREWHLHHLHATAYQDREINNMKFQPRPPDFSHVSGNITNDHLLFVMGALIL